MLYKNAHISKPERLLFNNMPNGCAYHKIIVDDNGSPCDYKFLEINQKFELLIGLNSEQVVEKTAREIIPGIEKEEFDWITFFGDIALNNKTETITQYFESLNCWLKVSAYSPEPNYFVAFFDDVTETIAITDAFNRKKEQLNALFEQSHTEREKAECRLRKNKRFLETLLSNLPGMVYRCKNDRNWSMQFVSEGCKQLTGYSPKQLTNNQKIAFNDLIKKEYQEKIWNKWQKTLKDNKVFIFEYPITTASGEEKWVWEQGRGIFDANGNLEALEGFIMDITERHKVLEELKESKQRNEAILNAMPDLLFINHRDGTYLDYYAENEEKLLVSPQNFLNKKIEEVFPPDFADKLMNAFKQALKSQQLTKIEYELPVDDIIHTYEARIIPCGKEQLLSIIRDITENKTLINELKSAKIKAEESDRLKSSFLATVSHELRTPLNAIIGFSELLEPSLSDDEIENYASIINHSGLNLLEIINNIFDISKIEIGEVNFNIEPVKVDVLFDEITQRSVSIAKNIQKEHLPIKTQLPDAPKDFINTDRSKIKQIMLNLVKNALKFTEEGYVELGYTHTEDHCFIFYVKDTGIGIPCEKQQHIFERFRQLEDPYTRRHDGTGLGLSICKELVELLGGKIWLESEPGNGSTFYFSLPCHNKSNCEK